MKVKLKISFRNTKAIEELDADLREIENEKRLQTPQRSSMSSSAMKRNVGKMNNAYLTKRLSSGLKPKSNRNLQFTSRPYSAKTDFNDIVSKNPYGRKNFSNRMMSSQHMMTKAPSMRTLPQRPQTAAVRGTMRTSSSIGKMKTIDSPYTAGPKSLTNMASYNKARKGKKPRPKIEDQIFEGEVNEEGVAIFENIPKTICYIDASENDFFKGSNKLVCLPTEAEKENIIEVYLPVERQDAYTTTVYMIKGEETEKEYTDEENKEENPNNYFENLSLRAVLLELFEKNNSKYESEYEKSEDSDLESEVEYEEEFEQFEDKNGNLNYLL